YFVTPSPRHPVTPSPRHPTGAAGRGRLYQARLHASASSAVSVRLTAARLSSSCSGRLAPTMADVTPGWVSTQETATCTSERPRAQAQGQGHLPRGVVRAADVAHLPLTHEVVEGAQGLLLGRVRVGGVCLVQVDVIGPQPAEAVLGGLEDVLARQALVVGPRAD